MITDKLTPGPWQFLPTEEKEDPNDGVTEFHMELSSGPPEDGEDSIFYHRADWRIKIFDKKVLENGFSMVETIEKILGQLNCIEEEDLTKAEKKILYLVRDQLQKLDPDRT